MRSSGGTAWGGVVRKALFHPHFYPQPKKRKREVHVYSVDPFWMIYGKTWSTKYKESESMVGL